MIPHVLLTQLQQASSYFSNMIWYLVDWSGLEEAAQALSQIGALNSSLFPDELWSLE